MKLRVPDYYKKFRCIDKDCTDSCCAGWEVDVDEESYAYYETVDGAFGERLHSVMSRDNGPHFILKPDKDCPFLNSSGLCDLYTELGEDKLCVTCAMYPRFVEEYGSVREMGIALSCKTAAELILTYQGKAGFEMSDDGRPVTSYNDINPNLYFSLCEARRTAYALVQNRAYTIQERLALLLDMADRMQHSMNGHRYSRIPLIAAEYSVVRQNDDGGKAAVTDIYADVRTQELDRICARLNRRYCGKESSDGKNIRQIARYEQMTELLKLFDTMEMVKDTFHEFIKLDTDTFGRDVTDRLNIAENAENAGTSYREFDAYYSDRMEEYEHIMVYYLFRYFLKAVYDNDLLGKVKLGLVGYIIVREMDMMTWKCKGSLTLKDQIEITHLYSREVEHSDENFAQLEQMYNTSEIFATDRIFTLIYA